jgi:trk system potassium uptake protein TrkH
MIPWVGNPLVNTVISFLFISGGIGFVVVTDILSKKRFRQYALHTKLMLIGTLALNLVAMFVLFLLEYGNPETLGKLPGWGAKLWAAWFQGAAPRSAGFNSIDIGAMLPASAFFIIGLMFIGGGSGSTAGGIKLSTFIVLLLATRTFLRQEERPVVFGRSIAPNMILKALAITVIALLCVMTGTFLLTVTESASFLDLVFEAVSAFGTVGLSRGVTADLSVAGQLIIMMLMLIGRVGPLTLAFTLSNRRSARIQYPAGQVNVG